MLCPPILEGILSFLTVFSKTYPSFLTVKEGSTFLTKPLFPQGREDVTALRCSEPLRCKVGGPSKVCARFCGLGPHGGRWGFRRAGCTWAAFVPWLCEMRMVMRTTRLSLMPSMLPTLICSGLA